jgi:hypothetical protein
MSIMDAPRDPRPGTHPGAPRPAWVWRSLAAVAVGVSAVVHLLEWQHGYRDIPWVGQLFLLNAVGGVVLTVLLMVWRHWLPLVGAIGFGAATLLAFVASTTVGFLGVTSRFSGESAWIAAAAEVVAVVAATAALLREQSR